MVFLSFQVYVFTKQSIVEQPFAHRLCCKCSVILLGDYCFNAQSAPNEFVLALFNLFLTAWLKQQVCAPGNVVSLCQWSSRL